MSDRPQAHQVAGWPRPHGYANVFSAAGRVVVTAGMIGWNPLSGEFESDNLVEQVGTALRNIVAALAAAGAEPQHVVRLTWFVTDRQAYIDGRMAIGELYRAVMGRHFPAMSVIFVSSLLEQRAKVEIEATAIVPPG